MNLDKRTQAFVMLTTMRQSGRDIMSCFVPIVLQAVPSYDFTDCATIQHDLANFSTLPELMVRRILDKAREESYVEVIQQKGQDLFKLKTDAVIHFIDEQKSAKKRVDELVKDIDSYFVNRFFKASKPILDIIDSFIDTCGFEINLIPPYIVKPQKTLVIEQRELRLLVEYLGFAQDKKSIHLNTFREVVLGKIISTVFDFPDFGKLNLESFNSCQLFLDTNFIFSILELHEPIISQPALALFHDYLENSEFKVNVFDFTVEQMRLVLRSYSPEEVKRLSDYMLPSIYRTLKKENWSKKQINEYINNIESKLKEKGIEVVSTGIVLGHYPPPKNKELDALMKEYSSSLIQCKPESSEFGRQHDMAAIMMVEKIRGGRVTEIKNANAYFLTSDHRLETFNKLDMKHQVNRTIGEVVLDTSFTSLLWVLSPKLHPEPFPLEVIIAAFSRNWFLSSELLTNLSVALESVLKKEKINAEEISSICYYNIQMILKKCPDDQSITPEYLKARMEESNIEEARRKQKDINTQNLLCEKDKTIAALTNENEELRNKCKRLEEYNENNTKEITKLKIILIGSFIVISVLVISGVIMLL